MQLIFAEQRPDLGCRPSSPGVFLYNEMDDVWPVFADSEL
jgi:hypothetical protein